MLAQKSGGVYPSRCLFPNSEITPQKEFSEEIDCSSKSVHGKDSSIYLSDSLSILLNQNFGDEHLLVLIRQNDLTDCLNFIEQHCGCCGEAALLVLAIAQYLDAALPLLEGSKSSPEQFSISQNP